MAKPETKLLIFDFDGTLYDSVGGIHKAVNIVAREKNVPEFDFDLVRSFVGWGITHLVERLDDVTRHQLGDIEAVKKRFREVYNKIALSESSLFPGVLEFLDSWPHYLAIVSNKEEFSLRKMVEGSPLKKYQWSGIYGADSFPERKPSPMPIEKVIDKLGLGKEECIFIGDGIPDCQAAMAAEIEFIGISFGYSSESDLKQIGAKRFISDFSKLLHTIHEVDASR